MFTCDCGSTHGDAHAIWCKQELRCLQCGIVAENCQNGKHYAYGDYPYNCPYEGIKASKVPRNVIAANLGYDAVKDDE